MHGESTTPARVGRFRFRLSTLVLISVGLGIAVGLTGVKLRQDYQKQAALTELIRIGYRTKIGSESGKGVFIDVIRAAPDDSTGSIHSLERSLGILVRPTDLGLTPGLKVGVVDLGGSSVAASTVDRLKQTFPTAQILNYKPL